MRTDPSDPGASWPVEGRAQADRLHLRRATHLRGTWGLADQAVVSLGNFLTGLVLVQTMPKQDFGIFFLVFGMLLFLNGLHASLVTYPLSLRGATSGADGLRRIAGDATVATFILALPSSLGVIAAATLGHQAALIPWMLAAMFFWQVQETLRRGMMAHLRHREALLGDAVSYIGQAAAVYVLARHGALALETAFSAMAATSLLGLLVQAWQLRPTLSLNRSVGTRLLEDWTLSRWMLLTNATLLLTLQAVPWTLGYFHGLDEVAAFGALAQVMGLTNPILIGITGLIVPAVAASSRRGVPAARRVALSYGLQGAALLLPYYAVVLLAPEWALRFVTLNPDYAGLGTHLQVYALGYASFFAAQLMQSLLNGLGQTRCTFVAQCVYSAATLLVGLPMVAAHGLTGAVWAGALSGLPFLATSMRMLRRTSAAIAGNGTDEPATSAKARPEGAVA